MARAGRKESGFREGSSRIHWNCVVQVRRALFDGELAESEFDVDFDSQRAQAHEVVDDLAAARAVIEEARLLHHFFGIEADSFIRTGIVVVAANGVWMGPGKRELEVVAGHAFMNDACARSLALTIMK